MHHALCGLYSHRVDARSLHRPSSTHGGGGGVVIILPLVQGCLETTNRLARGPENSPCFRLPLLGLACVNVPDRVQQGGAIGRVGQLVRLSSRVVFEVLHGGSTGLQRRSLSGVRCRFSAVRLSLSSGVLRSFCLCASPARRNGVKTLGQIERDLRLAPELPVVQVSDKLV